MRRAFVDIILRAERKEDERIVEELIRDAFWGYMGPTSDEHYSQQS